MSPSEIIARLRDAEALARAVPSQSDLLDPVMVEEGRLRHAAVLVPIVTHPGQPTVLLTLRASHLNSHSGQVAFPGGRIEAGETPEQAALREAAEEVGLDPRLPEVIGRLPDHLTGTGYRVTPVIGLVPPPLYLTPDPSEVEVAFEYPLATVLDPAAPARQRSEFRGRSREFWVWPHPDHTIWGATAAMLVNLARVLRA
jgi:8-oxo-dGTP pyrophosphatase MutT (NUDIX family)